MPVRMIGSGSRADVTVKPLPPFHLTRRVAGLLRADARVPADASLSTLRAAASRGLAAATISCPRAGRIDGERCVECPHLVGWRIEPSLRLWCAVDGEDPVADWMCRRVERTLSDARCADADRDAEAAGVHHLLVVDRGGALAGIVCRCDLLDPGSASVRERMTSTVYAASPSTTLRVALAAMRKLAINCLPVVDADGRVLGVLTRTELASAGVDGELER